MELVNTSFEEALHRAGPRTGGLDAALADLHGYSRFLSTAGHHLHLLADLTGFHSPNVTRLARRLIKVPSPDDIAPGPWMDLTTRLGAAHDLLATHITHQHHPRTADARDLLTATANTAATRAVTELVLHSTEAGWRITDRVVRSQRPLDDRPLNGDAIGRMRGTRRAITLYASAALWDLHAAPHLPPASTLDALQPAPNLGTQTLEHPVTHPLGAIGLLRELVHAQANRRLPASPASLRDLALLAAHVTDPDQLEPADNKDALSALRHADARDQLARAHQAWTLAAQDLTRTVQGLTKAPADYGHAIGYLSRPGALTPEARAALAAALPQLGRDAARAITNMAERGDLITPQRLPCEIRTNWRVISPPQAATLASRFANAADATVATVHAKTNRTSTAALTAAGPHRPGPRPELRTR